MTELRDLLTASGVLDGVSTYIASGNIICDRPNDPAGSCAAVRRLVHDEFSVDTAVIHRGQEELSRALDACPFPDAVEKLLHAMFLEGDPSPGAVETLRARLVPGEEIALVGRDLWINYAESGVHTSKLTKAVLDRALGVAGTARNLRTVKKLAELTA